MRKEERLALSPIIKFKGRNYSFSPITLLLYLIGGTTFAILMIQFLELRINFWLHEILAKQVVFILNSFFDVGAEALYTSEAYFPWSIDMPGDVGTYINHGCTGLIAMSIFASIIIFTPHSHESDTNQDIMWRKTVSIITTITLIYLFNVFRIAIQNYLYYRGFSWDLIHNSFGALLVTFIIHVLIFILCIRKLPEILISIYYSGKLIYNSRAKMDSQKEYQKRY